VETVRSFIAIELPENLRTELEGLVSRLKPESRGVKWVNPQSIHITLKFLGDVAADRLDEITSALKVAACGVKPFNLTVGGLGVFPNPQKVRVAWVGVSGDMAILEKLQQRVEHNLDTLGFARESRKFTPHLTLARVRERVTPLERQEFGQLIDRASFKADSDIQVKAVHLIRSQLTSHGAIYSRISTVELEGDDESSKHQ